MHNNIRYTNNYFINTIIKCIMLIQNIKLNWLFFYQSFMDLFIEKYLQKQMN